RTAFPAEALCRLPGFLLETVGIAAGGTALAAALAMPLALVAARNLVPWPLAATVRTGLEALRAVPEVVWGLVLVSLMSVGPGIGIIALGLHSAGVLGKLYAESFENVAPAPVRAIAATGA